MTSPLLRASVATIISRSARSRAAATCPRARDAAGSAAPRLPPADRRARADRPRATATARWIDVFELADVARDSRIRRAAPPTRAALQPATPPPPKRSRKWSSSSADVAAALAQRRQVDAVHVEAVEQVAAELAGVHRGLEVDVGRGDETDVDSRASSFSPMRRTSPASSARSSLACSALRHRPDLVEEQRAAGGVLDQAGPRAPPAPVNAPRAWPNSSFSSSDRSAPRSSARRTACRRAGCPRESRARRAPCRCRSRR